MNREDERREFFRIHDRLPIEFRRINPEDFDRLKDVIRYNSTQAIDKINEIYFLEGSESRDESEQMRNCIQIINKKLDMIIDHLHRSQCGEAYQSMQVNISISGAGVQFECDTDLGEGDYMELKIVIPIFPYPKISSLCEVVRTRKLEDIASNRYRIALKFLAINEKDRDLLINYVFVKEREYLRQKKETS